MTDRLSEQPPGLTFFDGRSQRRLLLVRKGGHPFNAWLCYQHAEGFWIPLRKATGRDLLSIQQATRDQTMDSDEPLTRTPEEILARIEELAQPTLDMFGTERSRLLEALPYESATRFLADDAPHTAESWEVERTKDRKSVIAQIRSYLDFAWGKANESRGLSAQRSLSHFKGLLWLLGPDCDEIREWIGSPEHYEYYGKPALVKISELISFQWHNAVGGPDNDEWLNSEEADPVTANEALGRG